MDDRHGPALASPRATIAYRDRRLAEGKTIREIICCLKGAIAREVYRLITA